tara:strand:+ start:1036 stop:1317 length:282 start_codon:yes stop_codon:yes gene_type:complete
VSLKSRKSIDIAGPDPHEEPVTAFRKESDNTYSKVTKEVTRDWKTGVAKEANDEEVRGPYHLTHDENDYDEKTAYQDFEGNTRYMYFKFMGEE